MMKIVASLIILGLCANVCFGYAPKDQYPTSITTSALNITFTKVFSAANSTDAAKWNTGTDAVTGPPAVAETYGGVSTVIFGPGETNDTSYVYGLVAGTTVATAGTVASIVKRTINNTVVSWANDTTEACVATADQTITAGIHWTSISATGPGYLALLGAGSDGTNDQVWVALLGSSYSATKLTAVADVTTAASGNTCTSTSTYTGDIWYDIGADAFFYTYYIEVESDGVSTGSGPYSCGTSYTYVYTIYLGGIYLNGTAYWSKDLALTTVTPTNEPWSVMSGPDNWLNSSNIYVVYYDNDATTGTTYVSKTSKASTTTAGTFSTLVADSTGATSPAMYYYPLGVWASNWTYGIAVSNQTETWTTGPSSYTNTITNFLNGTTTGTDSGLSYSAATGGSDQAGGLYGWQLNTGYALLGEWPGTTGGVLVLGTFYGNGTVNSTQTTLSSSLTGDLSIYEDVNGTLWIGWTDPDSANEDQYAYAGYLAVLQGQLNVSANVLATISAFCALFLASIFAF